MRKAISFEATAIAKYIYQNNTSHIKIVLKYCPQHGTELWMPDFLIICFFWPSVMLTTDSKK